VVIRLSPIKVALLGIGLLVIGTALTYVSARGFTEQHVVTNAGACKLEMNVVQLAGLPENSQSGSVVLFHGLAANKVILSYLARAFALQGLRVYVPDLPGHGRSPGPFTPDMAESCAQSFVRGLAARGYIRPDRTILAGHSMGGAIALRVAAKVRVAGVVAISPAPMRSAHGVTTEALLYQNPPAVPPNSLIIAGQFEPEGLRANAADLAASSFDGTTRFVLFPYNTHVSVLFSRGVARLEQEWAAQVLHLPATSNLPFRGDLLGALLGLAGILAIAGPFLRESVGEKPVEETPTANPLPASRLVLELGVVSFAVVALLHYWVPLRVLQLFEGDYLASFFLLAGLALVLLHPKASQKLLSIKWSLFLGTAFAAMVLHLLITGWLQLTITGAWLSLERWKRFPIFFVAAWVFLYAMEVMLGKVTEGAGRKRLLMSLGLLCVVWIALTFGVLVLHSGAILLVLLAPYFLVLFVLMRLGAQLVRRQSGSPLAAAIFGAILMAGFCLVLFPVS
jgi:pimeloyl-ACP methyl ester carboxylesterase